MQVFRGVLRHSSASAAPPKPPLLIFTDAEHRVGRMDGVLILAIVLGTGRYLTHRSEVRKRDKLLAEIRQWHLENGYPEPERHYTQSRWKDVESINRDTRQTDNLVLAMIVIILAYWVGASSAGR